MDFLTIKFSVFARQKACHTRIIFAAAIIFAFASVRKHFTLSSRAHSLKNLSSSFSDGLCCVTDKKRPNSQKAGGEFTCMISMTGDSEIHIHVDGSPHVCGQAETVNILQGGLDLFLFFQIPPLHYGFNCLPWWKGVCGIQLSHQSTEAGIRHHSERLEIFHYEIH